MAILKRQDEVVEARRGVGGGHRGVLPKIPLLRQGATKHVYASDLFHAFLQQLGLKLCRTGMCMG